MSPVQKNERSSVKAMSAMTRVRGREGYMGCGDARRLLMGWAETKYENEREPPNQTVRSRSASAEGAFFYPRWALRS